MKYVKYALIIMCLTTWGCSRHHAAATGAEGVFRNGAVQTDSGGFPGLEISVVPSQFSVVPKSVDLVVVNNTGQTVSCPTNYHIERYEAAGWREVEIPYGVVFLAVMLTIYDGETKSFELSLFTDAVAYEPGSYRVVKYFFMGDERLQYAAGFTVE